MGILKQKSFDTTVELQERHLSCVLLYCTYSFALRMQ